MVFAEFNVLIYNRIRPRKLPQRSLASIGTLERLLRKTLILEYAYDDPKCLVHPRLRPTRGVGVNIIIIIAL